MISYPLRIFLFIIGLSLTPGWLLQAQSLNETSVFPSKSASVVNGAAALNLNPANIALPAYRQRSELRFGNVSGGLLRGYPLDQSLEDLKGFDQDWLMIDAQQPLSVVEDEGFWKSEQGNNFVHYDALLAGFTQRRSSYSWGISVRSRGYNASRISEDWYQEKESAVTNRRLQQRMIAFHEIGLGYARPLEMVAGWRSGLNTVILGFNPKFVIGGMHFKGDYHSRYTYENSDEVQQSRSMSTISTGAMAGVMNHMSGYGSNASQAYAANINEQSLFEPSGYGAGIDVGVTWVIAIGNDSALAPDSNERLRNNLRFSISVNDIGSIRYTDETLKSEGADSTMVSRTPATTPYSFDGRPGEFHRFVGAHPSENEIYGSLEHTEEVHWQQLPTTLNLATSLHYSGFMIGADARYQVHDYNFFERGWHTRIATESTLLWIIPIRSAIIFDPDFNPSFQIGAGLDFRYVDLRLDARLTINSDDELRLRELSSGTLSIRF